MLGELHAMHVAEYHPCPTKPQIVFPSARIPEGAIMLQPQQYDQLKHAAWRRLQAVEDYIANDRKCRSRQLAAYFGCAEGVPACGCCDVCRRPTAPTAAACRDAIKQQLEAHSLSPHDLCVVLEAKGYVDVREVLRDMLDSGNVYLDRNLLRNVS